VIQPSLPNRRSGQGQRRTFESYGVARFRLHQASWVTSSMAMQMAQLARPWLAFEISDSALMLGVVAASQGLAQVVAAPFGGLAADRLPKRTVLLLSQIVLLGMVSVMAVLVALGAAEVWHLAVLAVIHGVAVTFNNPVRQAFIPLLLPRRLLANGLALHNGARSLNQVVGPAIVGILLEIEIATAFFVIVGLHVISVAFSTRLPRGGPERGEGRSIAGELLYGLRYVTKHKFLRIIVLLSVMATIFVHPYPALLPVFQKNVLAVGELALGLMFASVGLGVLVASLAVATFSGWSTKSGTQLFAGLVFGAVVVAFALSPFYLLSLLTLFVAGAASQVFSVANSTQMMYHADPALYGRVAGLNIWIRALMSIALLGYGALIDVFGAPATVATSGLVFIACVVGISLVFPWFRRGTIVGVSER
jgi:MFS family permease